VLREGRAHAYAMVPARGLRTVDVAPGQSRREVTARRNRCGPATGYVAELMTNWRSMG